MVRKCYELYGHSTRDRTAKLAFPYLVSLSLKTNHSLARLRFPPFPFPISAQSLSVLGPEASLLLRDASALDCRRELLDFDDLSFTLLLLVMLGFSPFELSSPSYFPFSPPFPSSIAFPRTHTGVVLPSAQRPTPQDSHLSEEALESDSAPLFHYTIYTSADRT